MAAASDQTPFAPVLSPADAEAHHPGPDGGRSLVRFVYRSQPAVLPASVLLDIVRSAEHRNAALGASGLLTYGPSLYAQVIEGSGVAVRGLAQLILSDARHRVLWWDLRPIPRREIDRSLPMGYITVSNLRRPLTGTEAPGEATRDRVTRTLLDAVADNYPSALLAVAPAE